jgi:3'-5' exoribonuclease
MKSINELQDGERVSTQLMVASALKGVTNNGLSYLTIEFRDATGAINGKKWEVTPIDEETFTVGAVVNVTADVIFYKTSLQLKVLSATKLDENEVEITRFIKGPPVEKEELTERLKKHIASIKDKDIHLLVTEIVKKYAKKLLDYPAAVSVHHEFASGLLYHTVSMADVAALLADYYKDIDKDILIGGVILHDIGKTIEFEGPVIYKYSLEGKLIGHISIMANIIKETADELGITSEVPILLEHMILSHHGEHEFGSPVLPMTKEAILLNYIDNIDSKMAIVEKALSDVQDGEFSQRIFAFDNRTLYKPKKR